MDRKYYSDEILEMLNDEESYSKVQTHHDEKVMEMIQRLTDKYNWNSSE